VAAMSPPSAAVIREEIVGLTSDPLRRKTTESF
jgi:hypothetical protein